MRTENGKGYEIDSEKEEQMVRIDEGLFFDGMRVNAEIFFYARNRYMLFCKNIRIDEAVLNKVDRLITEENAYFYVLESDYSDFLKSTQLESGEIEKRIDVQNIINLGNKTRKLFSAFEQPESVSQEIIEDTAREVYRTITSVDITKTLQCMKEIKEMDDTLYTHCRNVGMLNGIMASLMDLDIDTQHLLIQIGLLHDIGKLKIPKEILDKPGRLTDEEFEVIKQHPVHSEEMLLVAGISDRRLTLAVRTHHERGDGNGYPDKIGDPLLSDFAKITAVSDVYDAMISKRVYKNAISPFEIFGSMKRNRFDDLDSEIVDVFLKNVPVMYVGTKCTLNDGRQGTVTQVSVDDPEFPVVRVDNQVIKTTEDLKCVTVECFFNE